MAYDARYEELDHASRPSLFRPRAFGSHSLRTAAQRDICAEHIGITRMDL